MHKDPIEYLKHILDECKYIKSVITPELKKMISWKMRL